MEMTMEEKNALKGKGYIVYRDGDHFSCRVRVPAGKISAEQSRKLAEISETYGRGSYYFTQRLNVEIPWVALADLEKVSEELAQVGLKVGATGMRPRPAHTCKGTVCKFGLFDTDELAIKFDERFYDTWYDVKLPNKFRVAIAGCVNNCTKPQLACIGILGKKMGQVAITLGGIGGKEQILGREIAGLYNPGEALAIVEKALNYYKEHGQSGERFAQMVERLGFPAVEKALIG